MRVSWQVVEKLLIISKISKVTIEIKCNQIFFSLFRIFSDAQVLIPSGRGQTDRQSRIYFFVAH